jgi:long-subunit fatty acid transport protein
MIKKIIISACLFLSLVSFAQEGTASPYSYYGIGDVRFKGTAENRSMAGISVEQDSIHLNLENPASFANLKLSTFTVGGSQILTNLKSSGKSENARRTTLDYLAVGLPLGKFGVGFGLIPYSSVGYKISSETDANSQFYKTLDGSGGLNKVFLGLGYSVSSKFKIGADVNFNFGKIKTNSLMFTAGIPVGTAQSATADLRGANINIGTMYKSKINKKLNFFSSVNYTLESKLTSKNVTKTSAVMYTSGSNLLIVDSFGDQSTTANLKLPSKLSVSVGVGEAKKWLIGAQVVAGSKGNLVNDYNAVSNVSYESSMKYSLGGYYIPNYNSFSNYAKRIVYRGGLKFDKTGLMVNSESINDVGVNLGLGFPITGSFSNVNIGFEYGKRGTTSSDLVQENYATLSIGFSLNDKWFEKRKFN